MVTADDVRTVVGARAHTPDDSVIESFIDEAQARVEGYLGTLDASDLEAFSVVRDLAAARLIWLMRAGQATEPPRVAMSLSDNAIARLREIDERRHTAGGVDEVDAEAFTNTLPSLFTLEDVGLREEDTNG